MMDLARFAAAKRDGISAPFSRGDWTYATDGYVLVRVPRSHDFAESDHRLAKDSATLIPDTVTGHAFAALKPVTVPTANTECRACSGKGIEHTDCPDCECDCEDCEGKGTIATIGSVAIGKAIVGGEYYQRIATLPDLKFDTGALPEKPMLFVFDGGAGLIATQKEPSNPHVEAEFAP